MVTKIQYNIKYKRYNQTQLCTHKVVSDCIIYLLYYTLYFSLYSTQWGCLTWGGGTLTQITIVHTGTLGKRMTKVAVVLRIFSNGCIIRDTDIRFRRDIPVVLTGSQVSINSVTHAFDCIYRYLWLTSGVTGVTRDINDTTATRYSTSGFHRVTSFNKRGAHQRFEDDPSWLP